VSITRNELQYADGYCLQLYRLCDPWRLTDEHKDGWGIAFFEGRGARLFVDHFQVSSPVAELIKRYPIKSENVIAHIRKATQGEVNLENCHPFVRECWGQYWVFAHNGDLKEFNPMLNGQFLPVGSTDSERAFVIYCKACAEFGDQPPTTGQVAHFQEKCRDIAAHGTFNMMLSNGEALFTHCSTKLHYVVRQHPFPVANLSDQELRVDFSEVTTPSDKVAVIVTEPLTNNECWTQFGNGEFKVFVKGDVLMPEQWQ
jgi:glutamine amidotransferase